MPAPPVLVVESSMKGILEGWVIDMRIEFGSSVGNLNDPGPF